MTTRTRFLFLVTTLAGATMITACNKPADPLGPAPSEHGDAERTDAGRDAAEHDRRRRNQ